MARRSLIKLVTGSADDDNEPENENTPPEEDTPREEWMETEGNLAIDVYQDADDIVIRSTISGVTEKDLDITLTSDMVTIKGERTLEDKVDADDYYYQELYWGAFSRTIVLPQEIDTEGAKADLKDGVLTIRLPKLERTRSKKLKIN
jgi:HSP20 family protein